MSKARIAGKRHGLHRLEDYVAEDNRVRVIEVFVDELDLGALGARRELIEFSWPSYRFVITTSRYSLGATIVPSLAWLTRAKTAYKSAARSMLLGPTEPRTP